MLLPPPIVIALDGGPAFTPGTAWTSYLTPAATWRAEDLPVGIAFAGSGPPGVEVDLAALLDVSARPWSLPACTAAGFAVAPTRALTGSEANDGKNDVIVHFTDWSPPLATGAAGHTVLYTLGGRVVEADVHLNARDFEFAVGAVAGKIDLQAILTHELGHVLGVGHSAETRATMNPGLPSGIAARSLERDDVDAACALYPAPTAGARGCAESACPAPWTCVGFTCERPGEEGVAGGPCALEARPCEGAGDSAACVATTVGPRCARPCTGDGGDRCGVGMICVDTADGAFCLPEGAAPLGDAGSDASLDDAAVDTSPKADPPSAGAGCACRTTGARTGTPAALLLALALIVARPGLGRGGRRRGGG